MIFVNNISDLQYYNTAEPWGCYGDAIFQPSDILLQANGFTPSTTLIGVIINVCDITGAFQEDATAFFDLYFGSFTIAGTTYYFLNIKGNGYSPFMESNRCFVLNVMITDASTGTFLFNKFTQKYEIVTVATSVFVETVNIDGETYEPCVAGSNPAICSTSGEQYVKFTSKFDCIDAFTGTWYAEGSPIFGTPFTYVHQCYINARFRRIPTEVERTISINCRTQRTAITDQYELKGNVAFPVWKKTEIEYMLLGNKLYIDDTEFQSPRSTPFTQLQQIPKNCIYMYKMLIPFQGCLKWQIFGCVPKCSDLAAYYMFPFEFEKVYDDGMRPIAYDISSLVTYFSSITGTSVAMEVNITLPCASYATFKVISTGVLPKFLYYDNPIPAQRIYPKQLDAQSTDLSALCNGVTTNNLIPVPDVTGVDTEQIVVPVPDVTGVDSVSYDYYTVQIATSGNWSLSLTPSSAVNWQGVGTLNMSLSNSVDAPPYLAVTLGNIQAGAPSRDILITPTENGNIPPSGELLIQANGDIVYTGPQTSDDGMGTYYLELFNIKYPL